MSHKLRNVVDCLRSLVAKHHHGSMRDSELLRIFVETRSSDAFAGIMRRHGAMVLGLARRIVRDQQLAEDVFQATFLVLARKARSVRGRESLPAWLHRVALRLAIRAKKSRQRLREHEARARPISSTDPLDEISVREMLAILDEELSRLPEKYRLPLILCHLEGLSQHEAARRLDVGPGSIKGMLERGRLLLRKRLIARGLHAGAALAGVLHLGSAAQAIAPRLFRATLDAALTSQKASAGAVALAEGAIMLMTVTKVKMACWAVVLLSVVGVGAGWIVRGAGPTEKGEPAVGSKPALAAQAASERSQKARAVDLYGDRLPQGAALRLGTVQLRAAGASLALSADGKTLIGVRRGKFVSFWNAESGRLQATRELPIHASQGAVLSPDGGLLATDDLEVWDVRTGKLSRKLSFNKGGLDIQGIRQAFSQNGAYVAYVGINKELYNKPGVLGGCFVGVWDLSTGKQLLAKDLPRAKFYRLPDQVGFTPDGKRLLVSYRGTLYCWDIAGGTKLWQSEQFFNVGALFAFSPDGAAMWSGSPAVELATGRQTQMAKLPPPEQRYSTHQMLVAPDGRTLLLSRPEGVVVWDLTSGQAVRTLAGTGDMVLSPDGKTLITNDGVLQRWDLATGKALFADNFDKGHAREITALVFSADGKRLASGADDGSVRLWDTISAQPVRFWRGHGPSGLFRFFLSTNTLGVNALAMTPDGRWVASCGDGKIKIWDAVSGKESRSIELPGPGSNEAGQTGLHLHFHAEGKKLVGTFGAMAVAPPSPGDPPLKHNHWLATWDLRSGTMLTKAAIPISTAASSGFSRDGKWLLAWGRLIDTATGKVGHLEGADPSLVPSAFSPDGSLIASGGNPTRKAGNSSNVVIHESATGKQIATLETKSAYGQLAFHPSGRLIGVADSSGIQVWDIAAAKQVAGLKVPGEVPGNSAQNSCASCMVFAPDGRRLATGHGDGMIFIWNVDLPKATVKRGQPDPKEIELLWADLKDPDAGRAWRAVWRLTDLPDKALALLRRNLKPFSGASPKITGALLADLAGDVFAKRDAAGKKLKALGILAEPALRERLKSGPPLELRLRIEALLKAIAETPPPLTVEVLRDVRAVAVLARMQAPQARQFLDELAQGAESAPLTRAAKAALGLSY